MNRHDRAYKRFLQQLFTSEMLGADWEGVLDFSEAKVLPNEHLSSRLDLRQK